METNLKEKKYIYIYNHFAIYLKLTQHCESTIHQLKQKDLPIEGISLHHCAPGHG